MRSKPVLVLVTALTAVVAARSGHASTLPRTVCPVASPPNAYLASWSPTGDRVALAQAVGADTAMPVIAADGSGVVGGFQDPWDSPPLAIALSPEGRLALLKRTGEIDIQTPFEVVTQVAPRTDPSVTSELGGWSPDGTRVVYTRATYDPSASALRATMFVYDTRTASTQAIGSGGNPAWSPDGQWIAFVDQDGTIGSGIPARALELEHPDGSGRHTLLRDVALYAPGWSPDGTHVVFLWAIDRAPHVETVAVDGSDRRDVVDAFGPVFWTSAGLVVNLPSVDYGTTVAVVDPRTGHARGISRVPFRQYGAAAIAVSPDGRKVAYTIASNDGNPAFGIRIVNIDGTGDRSLLDCLGTDASERIVGSPLADIVRAGGGNDVVDVRGGGIDTVSCGRGHDRVLADRRDHVARDCERVTRGR